MFAASHQQNSGQKSSRQQRNKKKLTLPFTAGDVMGASSSSASSSSSSSCLACAAACCFVPRVWNDDDPDISQGFVDERACGRYFPPSTQHSNLPKHFPSRTRLFPCHEQQQLAKKKKRLDEDDDGGLSRVGGVSRGRKITIGLMRAFALIPNRFAVVVRLNPRPSHQARAIA